MDEQRPTAANAIEIRIEKIAQLFHSLDPFPFREKDLDNDVEEFIVGWARELPPDKPLRIVVHLPETEASTPEAHELGAALTQYFSLAPGPIGRVVEESLLIFGWVANWRPIEIFLYDWWPIVRRRNLYQRLSAAHVKLRPYKNGDQKRQAVLKK